jgi:predicted amidohydrolase YtcJ
MDLPLEQWPHPTRGDKIEFLQEAMKSLHSFGIVGIHDAGVLPAEVEIYNEYSNSVACVDRKAN